MTLETRLTRYPLLLIFLKARLNPLFCFSLLVTTITGLATESLVHCSLALAEATHQTTDRASQSIDSASIPLGAVDSTPQYFSEARLQHLKRFREVIEPRSRFSLETTAQALSNAVFDDSTSGLKLQPSSDTQLQAAESAVTPAPLIGEHSEMPEGAIVSQHQWVSQQLLPESESLSTSRLLLADSGVPSPTDKVLRQGSEVLGVPSVQLQGVFKQEGSDTSARARIRGFYPVTPNAGFGAELDLTTGRGFSDSQQTGLNFNELYFAGSIPSLPTLRYVIGLMDLTSYFDRNSFAKDGATHFFNSVFQTNPALAAAGIASRPGLLVNWDVTDDIDIKAATFSSTRNLGDFHLDAFAGEIGVRFGTAIIRGTYVSSRDAGQRSGFREIFDIPRVGRLGPQSDDREEAYGINGEYFIPSLKLGLFARYGHYTDLDLDASGTTYSAGLNLLDLFLPDDRLGLGYGRQLSNNDLRRDRGDKIPDVLELFYDFRVTPNLRAAVMIQERNAFSETVLGFRVRTDFDISSLFRRSR